MAGWKSCLRSGLLFGDAFDQFCFASPRFYLFFVVLLMFYDFWSNESGTESIKNSGNMKRVSHGAWYGSLLLSHSTLDTLYCQQTEELRGPVKVVFVVGRPISCFCHQT